jgi:glycosyltransferase involved in cell wall biosynthesis
MQLRWLLGKKVKIIILHRAEKPFKGWKKWIQQLADKSVDAYLFTSAAFASQWKNNIDTGKIHEVIQASSVFGKGDRELARHKLNTDGKQLFLWVGSLIPRKDPLTVVDAFLEYAESQPGARLYMIYQADTLLQEIESICKQHPRGGAVKMVGHVPHEQLSDWYNSAEFFITGSHYEGSGVAVSEAMSCGCIPITTSFISFQRMTGNGSCGLMFEAGNKKQLVDILKKSASLDIGTESKKVLEIFEKELSFQAIAKKINQVLGYTAPVQSPQLQLSNEPMVSVIIPTYNRGALIAETIDSVRAQTYRNWELIIVDDGSDDDTEKIIADFHDERLHFIKCGRTGIVGQLKNTGIKKSSGELIAFLDSDDLWSNDKVEKQLNAFKENPEAGFCLTNGFNFREKNEPLEFFYQQKDGSKCADLFISLFRSEVAAYTQALMFHKKCLELAGYFPEVNVFSDAAFITALARHFKGVIIYEPLVQRRMHDFNYIFDNTWEKSYHEGIELINQYSAYLPATISHNALFKLYINFGEKYIGYGQTKNAIWKFIKAWTYRPSSIIPIKKTLKAIRHSFFR